MTVEKYFKVGEYDLTFLKRTQVFIFPKSGLKDSIAFNTPQTPLP